MKCLTKIGNFNLKKPNFFHACCDVDSDYSNNCLCLTSKVINIAPNTAVCLFDTCCGTQNVAYQCLALSEYKGLWSVSIAFGLVSWYKVWFCYVCLIVTVHYARVVLRLK